MQPRFVLGASDATERGEALARARLSGKGLCLAATRSLQYTRRKISHFKVCKAPLVGVHKLPAYVVFLDFLDLFVAIGALRMTLASFDGTLISNSLRAELFVNQSLGLVRYP